MGVRGRGGGGCVEREEVNTLGIVSVHLMKRKRKGKEKLKKERERKLKKLNKVKNKERKG